LEDYKLIESEGMKAFLQAGLDAYAPSLVALSEFRRQIRTRLQTVLAEFTIQLADLGLPVDGLTLKATQLDNEDFADDAFSIVLWKNHGDELYSYYRVVWKSDEQQRDKQVSVGAWVYVRTRSDRDRLFRALAQNRSLPSKHTNLRQLSDGTSELLYHFDPNIFFDLGDHFRAMIQEWVGLLTAVGGVQPFLSNAASETSHVREIVLEVGCDGGSMTLTREKIGQGPWRFRLHRDEDESAAVEGLSDEDRSGMTSPISETFFVDSFHEGINLLDRHRWVEMCPIRVHPNFLDSVLLEVRNRSDRKEEMRWQDELKLRS